jgi:tartrate dehydratase beta subunit/fumarate hydratase class I family protein
VACLAIVADGVQRESRCVAFADLGSRGMLLEFEREGRTILVSWSTTGEISAQTASTE